MINKIGIISLSSGILGEDFVKHELLIGCKRLKDYGINVEFMPNSLKGIEFLKKYPEQRAKDILHAFKDDDIDMILCAIGGEDTYRLLPFNSFKISNSKPLYTIFIIFPFLFV